MEEFSRRKYRLEFQGSIEDTEKMVKNFMHENVKKI